MAMTPEEIDAALLDFANNHCRQGWTAENAPAGVKLFIEKAAEFLSNKQGLQAKRLADASWSYSTDFPKAIIDLLKPYRKVVFV
jgi:hypothetical protein